MEHNFLNDQLKEQPFFTINATNALPKLFTRGCSKCIEKTMTFIHKEDEYCPVLKFVNPSLKKVLFSSEESLMYRSSRYISDQMLAQKFDNGLLYHSGQWNVFARSLELNLPVVFISVTTKYESLKSSILDSLFRFHDINVLTLKSLEDDLPQLLNENQKYFHLCLNQYYDSLTDSLVIKILDCVYKGLSDFLIVPLSISHDSLCKYNPIGGHLRVDISQPLPIKDFYIQYKDSLSSDYLQSHCLSAIFKNQRIMAPAVVAFAIDMRHVSSDLSYDGLIQEVKTTIEMIKSREYEVGFSGEIADVIEYSEQFLPISISKDSVKIKGPLKPLYYELLFPIFFKDSILASSLLSILTQNPIIKRNTHHDIPFSKNRVIQNSVLLSELMPFGVTSPCLDEEMEFFSAFDRWVFEGMVKSIPDTARKCNMSKLDKYLEINAEENSNSKKDLDAENMLISVKSKHLDRLILFKKFNQEYLETFFKSLASLDTALPDKDPVLKEDLISKMPRDMDEYFPNFKYLLIDKLKYLDILDTSDDTMYSFYDENCREKLRRFLVVVKNFF